MKHVRQVLCMCQDMNSGEDLQEQSIHKSILHHQERLFTAVQNLSSEATDLDAVHDTGKTGWFEAGPFLSGLYSCSATEQPEQWQALKALQDVPTPAWCTLLKTGNGTHLVLFLRHMAINPREGDGSFGQLSNLATTESKYQNILDCESATSEQDNCKIMVRNVLQQASGGKLALPQGHINDGLRNKSMENLTFPQTSSTAMNSRRLQTSFDFGKAAPTSRLTTFPFATLQTASFIGSFRKSETESSIATTTQPLTQGAKPWTELSFSSSQSNSRRQQWSAATSTGKDSARKEVKLSRKSKTPITKVPDTACDSAASKRYERTQSILDHTRRILHQGHGKPSSPSVKERSALYLSETAAHAGSLPKSNTTKESAAHPLDSQKASKRSIHPNTQMVFTHHHSH
ncbi:protein tyrosine phosphatase type IVA 1 [Platysternon megacephalum]|uniref:Protein tyrosine phosphatase type IVA 1 n=1 Tax=Platysternon megacephalum TaxID=55544 RepID=A0A4D9E2B7_9SAUR|nr:protein tyrosine phosphatase type IVA 1 [Platysternon megacephalum]